MALLLDTLNSIDEQAVVPQTTTFDTPMWQSLQIQRISQLRCHRCQCTSDNLERLTTFPLEVPAQPQHVETLLASQFGEQPLNTDDDGYRCPAADTCPLGTHVTRTLKPRAWPRVLIINFKRWKTYFHNGVHRAEKLSTQINFEVLMRVPEGTLPYHLRGVIEHHGTAANGGHYTSYVRSSNNSWYHCNDSCSPRHVPTEQVLSAQAYLLIYEM